MTITTSYGTWCSRVDNLSTGPDADVLDFINGGGPDWLDLLETSGALAEMKQAYRAAIEQALPPSVSLCGDEFFGPWDADVSEFGDYPKDEYGGLDIAAIVQEIDLATIVEANDPETVAR